MSEQVFRFGDLPIAPWKNGGGVTRQITSAVSADNQADFDWRISLAEIGRSGPFSAYPGLDRVFVVVDGRGATLTVDGEQRPVAPLEPLRFSGDLDTTCSLLSPVRALNVMSRSDRCEARVEIDRIGDKRQVPMHPGSECVVVALCDIALSSASSRIELSRLDAVQLGGDHPYSWAGTGLVIRVSIRPLEPEKA